MTAPDRIWATEGSENFGEDKFHSTRPFRGGTEYLRATPARLLADELAEALRAIYRQMDYPQHFNAQINELCRAALAKLEDPP